MFRRIPLVSRGDTIRADWTNELVKQINRNSRKLYSLRQFDAMDANNGHNVYKDTGGGGAGGSMPSNAIFVETSRNAVSEEISDSASDTHNVFIATNVVMTSTNTGTTYTWTFRYDNPT